MYNGLSFLNKDESGFDSFFDGANFASNEPSNLADIFENDDPDLVDSNPTLKYISPKSNQQQKTTGEKSTWDVVIAKIVNAFKLVNNTNVSQGQMGIALLKNPNENASKLILYKTKDNILSTLQMTKAITIFWKPPYLQYHDSQNGFWSLLFANDMDSSDLFAKLQEFCTIDRANVVATEANAKTKPDLPSKTMKSVEPQTVKKAAKTDAPDDVIQRVARIGHQLPIVKPSADDDSDSTFQSDTEKTPSIPPIKSAFNRPDDKAISSMYLPPKPANISVAFQPSTWSSSSTFDLNSFAAENRMQNTEVRMNLSKLDTKLDKVLDNVERLWLVSPKSNNAQDKEEEMIKLEEKVLELKKENRALKLQIGESDRTSTEMDDKKKQELIELQKNVEEKDLKIVELTSKILELEQKLNAAMESTEQEKQQLITNHSIEMKKLREDLEKRYSEQQTVEQSNTKSSNESNGETIRKIMNQFYGKLYQSIEGKDSLTPADILKLTAEIIRKETKAALNSN